MKYTVFNVEKNRDDYLVELRGMSEVQKQIGKATLDVVMEHQQVANERHNEAMLEKDIEIAALKAKVEIYESRNS